MPSAKIKYTDGMQFVGETGSGHAIVMDSDTEFGGSDTGVRPTELLLVGVGGCSGMDIVSVLKKKHQKLTGLEVNVEGKKAEDYPQKFTDIHIEFIVKGKGLSEEAVKRAVDLSMDKYCSVKATLEGTAKITFSYTLVED
ncbi:MAG: OsmC family peroxiredoxin [Nitrospirae bacterium]|nr:MAG: OsmC family peroxiredoxin [Nitrospirota bacterium]